MGALGKYGITCRVYGTLRGTSNGIYTLLCAVGSVYSTNVISKTKLKKEKIGEGENLIE